jgi:hypothetical protein
METMNGSNEKCNTGSMKRIVMTFKEKKEDAELIGQILLKANEKEYGDPVTHHDLLMMGVRSLTDKHIEKLKEGSLNPRQRIEKAYREAIEKDGFKGTVDEFVCSRAKI